jgi:hypothetical protein
MKSVKALCLVVGTLVAMFVPALAFAPSVAQASGMTATETLNSVKGAVTGQPIVFTATITNGTSTPTGLVTFTITDVNSTSYNCDGGTNVIGLVPNSGGAGSVAACSIAAGLQASLSPYAVTAAYGGDASDNPTSASISKTIKLGSTTTTINPSSNPAKSGEPLTFTAVVAPTSPATGTPTGSVTFTIKGSDNSTASCDGGSNTIMLTGNSAVCSVSNGLLFTGSVYTVTGAFVSGDTNFNGSTGTLSQTIGKGLTTITVDQTSPTPGVELVTGQPVTFTANVAVTSPAAGMPTGSVIFTLTGSNGTTVTCDGGDTVSLAGTTSANCVLSAGLKGAGLSYTVSAVLSDPNYKSPVAGTLTVPVGKPDTAVTLSGFPGSVAASQAFAVQAKVKTVAPGTGKPEGFVTIAICVYGAATCTGEPGSGTFALSPTGTTTMNSNKIVDTVAGGLPPGFYEINATYVGTANFKASDTTNAPSFLTVDKDTTTTVIDPSHSPVAEGSRVVLRAIVEESATASGQLGAPTGTVTFTIQGTTNSLTCDGGNTITISTTTKNQGLAKCVIDAGEVTVADQPYAVTAVYSDDPNYTASTGYFTLNVVPATS